MYELLRDIPKRPQPFSHYTAKKLWTRPYLACQMLDYHLSQDTELASRPFVAIDQVVEWINTQLDLSGKSLCDLGCGPGLYAQRFASREATVTGIDFSAHSLDYARNHGAKTIQYIEADYLTDELPTGFDVITLIYTDLCVLSPQQRHSLLQRIRKMLNPEGHIVFDVAGMGSFSSKQETTIIEDRLMNGFWAEGDYIGIQQSFIYRKECLSLDRYLIAQPNETWQIYNWFQYFSPESLQTELNAAGLKIDEMVGELTGKPLTTDSDFIGIIASMK